MPEFVSLGMLIRLLLSFWAVLLITGLSAQSDCGTVMSPTYQSTYNQRVQQIQPGVIQGAIVVPVHIHLVRESNGNSNLTLQQIQTELDSVNYYYDNAGLIFIECIAAEMIDDDSMYDYESSTDETYLLTNHHTPNVLNLYFANTVSMNSTYVCGYAWYPGGPDAAFVSGTCATNGSTLAHEIGHYMGLMHTHGGSSDELVDGSNCSTEGDWICDTPADPGLSGLVDTACMYTGTALDANNQPYQPDVTNIMSYSRKVCRTSFSPMQYAMINATYWSDRTYLQCISTGIEEISQESQLFPNPANDDFTISFGGGVGENTVMEIYDHCGKLVSSESISPGTVIKQVSTVQWSPGVYSIVIRDDVKCETNPIFIFH
jgi:hypothetical protein